MKPYSTSLTFFGRTSYPALCDAATDLGATMECTEGNPDLSLKFNYRDGAFQKWDLPEIWVSPFVTQLARRSGHRVHFARAEARYNGGRTITIEIASGWSEGSSDVVLSGQWTEQKNVDEPFDPEESPEVLGRIIDGYFDAALTQLSSLRELTFEQCTHDAFHPRCAEIQFPPSAGALVEVSTTTVPASGFFEVALCESVLSIVRAAEIVAEAEVRVKPAKERPDEFWDAPCKELHLDVRVLKKEFDALIACEIFRNEIEAGLHLRFAEQPMAYLNLTTNRQVGERVPYYPPLEGAHPRFKARKNFVGKTIIRKKC